ncbi:MAG: beta-lactamase family protein, partial [Gemmatimonadetes bacterium]|nr:beta-lactamase family protein [Gemmatimonadota bacterium]
VLVERGGEIVLHEGYGLANREAGIPVTPRTVFGLGSIPIDFTHVALLKLMEEGKLSRDDRVTEFFPDVPEDKRSITVGHLMTGASGLPDFHDLPEDRDPDHSWIDRDEALRRMFGQELLFAPGTQREHSHSAWGMLAAIVEVVSGKSFRDYTSEVIYEPAGMVDTGFNGDPVPADRLAIGYSSRTDGEQNAPPHWGPTSWLVMGSGGQVSTAADLYRFQKALREGRLLGEASVRRYFGPTDGDGMARAGDQYGFWCGYSQGADSKFIVLSNNGDLSSVERRRALQRLGEDLLELVRSDPGGTEGALDPAERARRAREWVELINRGDAEAFVEFSRMYRAPAEDQDGVDADRARQYDDFRRDWGVLKDVEVRTNEPRRVVVRAVSERAGTMDFVFRFDRKEPGPILAIMIERVEEEGPGDR